MQLLPEQLDYLAGLAKLDLSPDERERFATQIPSILEYVEQLQTVVTEHVPIAGQLTGLTSVMRSDEVNYDFDREALLQTMPDTDAAGFLRVQAVFADEDTDE